MVKGKRKGRRKEDSLKNVGRTHGHKGTLCTKECYALHWTVN